MQRVKRRKGLGFKHEAMNDEGVIEQMEPEEDQRAVVGDSREQTELEEGGGGQKATNRGILKIRVTKQ